MEFLEKLRQKPEPIRRAIAFWTSAVITFLILSVWVTRLGTNFSNKTSQVASPFETIKNDLSNLNFKAESN
ncbi:MAG TPA: hypothetical protein VJK09_03420 [Candidatus Paceibacterota bacterium]